MNILLYKFEKKRNSTLVPPSTMTGIAITANINDANSSIMSPQLRIAIPGNLEADALASNYVHIPAFSRYYYVDDIRYNADGTWTYSCSVDVLASFKTDILGSYGYVGRASNPAHVNTNIPDSFYPAEANFIAQTDKVGTGFYPTPETGAYIISVVSKTAPSLGAVSYYVVTAAQLATLVDSLVGFAPVPSGQSLPTVSEIDDISGDVLKSLVNPFQFISSCKWYPFAPGALTGQSDAVNDLVVFGWGTGTSARKIRTNGLYHSFVGGNFPLAELTGVNVDEYPHYAPYAQYSLITPWGTYELDSAVIAKLYADVDANHRLIYFDMTANLVSGMIEFEAYCFFNNNQKFILARNEANFAVDIPLAQVSIDYYSAAKAMTSAVGEAGNAVGWITNPIGTGANVANHILDATKAAMSPSVAISGSTTGGINRNIEYIILQIKRFHTITKANGIYGSPVKKPAQISNIVTATYTYIQMDQSNFASETATSTETDAIVNYLQGGVYIE